MKEIVSVKKKFKLLFCIDLHGLVRSWLQANKYSQRWFYSKDKLSCHKSQPNTISERRFGPDILDGRANFVGSNMYKYNVTLNSDVRKYETRDDISRNAPPPPLNKKKKVDLLINALASKLIPSTHSYLGLRCICRIFGWLNLTNNSISTLTPK